MELKGGLYQLGESRFLQPWSEGTKKRLGLDRGGSGWTCLGLEWPWSILGISPVDPQPAECGRGCFAVGSAEAFGATGPHGT